MGTAEATLRMDSMEVKDEWQDEDFPRYFHEFSICVYVSGMCVFVCACLRISMSKREGVGVHAFFF